MEIISITDNYSVSGELNRNTIEKLANLGVVSLINVRPDGEAQGQMSSREYAAICQDFGLTYIHIPVKSGEDIYQLSGFLEMASGVRLSNDPIIGTDKTLSDLRLQVQFDYDLQASQFSFVSDAYFDGVLEQTRINIREATWQARLGFLGAWGNRFDAKVGQQVLTWGTGDNVFLNDLFPKDFQSFFAGREVEYLKSPSLSAKVSAYFDVFNLDVVLTPEFEPDVYINGDYFSFFLPTAASQVALGFDVTPPLRPQSPEYALRLYKSVGTSEYAGYFYSGFHKSPNSITQDYGPTFSSLNVYGASFRTTLGNGIFNAEFAYYDSVDDKNGDNPLVPNGQARWLLGYEQEIVGNLEGSLQLHTESILDHQALIQNSLTPKFEPKQHRVWFTQRLRYKGMQQALVLNAFNFYSTTDQDGYLKVSAEYSPVDLWRLSGGLNIFYGKQPFTFWGQFEDASNLFVRFRYFY